VNRRLIALDLILVALLTWGGTQLRRRWQDARRHEAEVLAKAPVPLPVVAPPSPAPVSPAPAAEYIDVAQRTLFSADRNPNVVIEVAAPKPEPPVPPMPAYHGQMALGAPVILLSTTSTPQKGYRAGDNIGEFKIVAFDRESVTLGWNGKELARELRSLAPKDPPPARSAAKVNASQATTGKAAKGAPAAARNAATPAPAAGANVAQIGGGPNTSAPAASSKRNALFGPPSGENFGCLPTDTSPAGTVLDGYRKVTYVSLMGSSCTWEPNK
jgi:hypothetical protein